MSSIAQRRTAGAAAIMMLFAVLQYVLLTVNPAPAMAATSTVSWDYPTGLALTPGTETQVATLAVPDPMGSECVATVEETNGESVHLGNNLNVYLNGSLFIQLLNFEDVPFQVSTASEAFVAIGSDQFEVFIESTGSTVTSASGSLTVTCEPPPPNEVTVSVDGECFYDGSASYVYTVTADAGVTVDFDGQDLNLTNGETYTSDSGSASWEATAPNGSVFAGTESGTATGVVLVEDCTPTSPSRPRPTTPEVKSALGDLVWFDENENGQQDASEEPVLGATVTLLSSDGTVLAQQQTGPDGLYLFDDLEAGTYRVQVCLAGAEYTSTNTFGVADDVDSDVFATETAGCGLTALINLPEGVTDLTWDAGIVIEVRGIQVEPTTTTAPTTTTIEPVTVETLPFTGLEVEDMALLGVGALAAGSVLLLLMGRREDESDVDVVSGWSNN